MYPVTQNDSPPRRVLFIDHTAELGGGEIALLNLIRHLDRRRYEPAVMLFADGPLRQKLCDAGVEVHLLPLDPSVQSARKDALGFASVVRWVALGRLLVFIWKVRRFVSRRKFDIIHTNSLKADVIGGVAACLMKRPVIWHVRDRIDEDYLPASVAAVFRRLCRVLPTMVIANSTVTLNTLRLQGSTVTGRTVYSGVELSRSGRRVPLVVHDGLTTPSGPSGPGEPGGDSVAGLLTTGPRRVALVGRLSRWKGQHVFVAAAARVRARLGEVHFLIVGAALFGEEEYERQLHQQVHELGLDHAVEFTGFRDDIPALMASVDVLVHASITAEPFGQVIVEAMAAGRPVVATAAGGPLEIIDDGVNGLLVPMGNSEALADAVCRLLQNPAFANQMGRAGRERVLDRFTIARTAAAVQQVYDGLLVNGDR